MIELSEFRPYLQSILDASKGEGDWGDRYIPTQSELPLRVQTYKSSPNNLEPSKLEEKNQREQFAVLDGLRKYAPEQVLLVGKPGSGKSTALQRLQWEEANRCAKAIEQNQEMIPPIPVLLELRSLGGSVLELLRETLEWRGVDLEERTLKALLREKQILLLLDGVNELPNDATRQAVGTFRQFCASAKVPLIFTTRELGAGFDLGVSRKLEMLPLSESQVREFVQKQLPKQEDVLLRQMQGRLRELAETPLLLKLLCEVFRHNQQQVPRNRGELFRMFARDYDQIKPWDTVTASTGFREFRDELLRELAAAMMQGEQPTELRLQISRDEAERILEKTLNGRVEAPGQRAKEWLGDLIEHHLLQIAADSKQIEFHHQMFQEYYAAGYLFSRLTVLSDEELKFHYLNYLKWTEPLAMMMAFLQSKTQAKRLVKLALNVDWELGARLSGEVKLEFQTSMVSLIDALELPKWLKVKLLGTTRSDTVIPILIKALEDEDSYVKYISVEALGQLGSEKTIPGLFKALKYKNSSVFHWAAEALGQLGSEKAIPGLLKVLKCNKDSDVRRSVAEALGKLGSTKVIPDLLNALQDQDSRVRASAAYALGELGSKKAIPNLLKLLEDKDEDVMWCAAYALGELGSKKAIPSLLKLLEDDDEDVRWRAVKTLGDLDSEQAILGLVKALNNKDSHVRSSAAYALGELGSKKAIPNLLNALQDQDSRVRSSAAYVLGELGPKKAIPNLLKTLDDKDEDVRASSAEALGKLGSEKAIPNLLKALEEEEKDSEVYMNVAEALGMLGSEMGILAMLKGLEDARIFHEYLYYSIWSEALVRTGSKQAISSFLKALQDEDSHIRYWAANALRELGSKQAIPNLIKALEYEDSRGMVIWALGQQGLKQPIPNLLKALKDKKADIRKTSAVALGQIGLEHAIPGLLEVLEYEEDYYVCMRVAGAIKDINKNFDISYILSCLVNLIFTRSGTHILEVMSAIQSRCGYYSYDVAQSPLPKISTEISKGGNPYNFPNAQKVQIIEHIDNYNENHNP